MGAYFKRFDEILSYSDPCSKNQLCRDILPKGIVDGLLVGYDRITGPGRNGLGRHEDFDQVFVVLKGRGTLLRGSGRILLEAPSVIHIPRGTEHDVFVAEGDEIEYVYVNRYEKERT